MYKKCVECEQYIDMVMDGIMIKFDEMGIQVDLFGCLKYIYSVFKKMIMKNKQFNEIYDLFVICIIVDNIKDCYVIFGIIYILWKLMFGCFKDYIVMFKVNMY